MQGKALCSLESHEGVTDQDLGCGHRGAGFLHWGGVGGRVCAVRAVCALEQAERISDASPRKAQPSLRTQGRWNPERLAAGSRALRARPPAPCSRWR